MAPTTPKTSAPVVSPALGFALYGNATSRGGIVTASHPHPHDGYSRTRHDGEYVDRCSRADPEKNALLGACTNVIHLTRHIGTELYGIQLTQLSDKQKDELGLLIAERSVVFFRDQEISHQSLLLLGEWYRETEGHPQVAQVPGVPGVTVIGPNFHVQESRTTNFMQLDSASRMARHSDLVHSDQLLGVIHHDDTISDDYDTVKTNCLTNDKFQFKWTPGTSALWDNRVLMWMTQS